MYNSIRGIKAVGFSLKRMLPAGVFRMVLRIYHRTLSLFEEPVSWCALRRADRSLERAARANRPVRFGFYVMLSSMFQWRRVFELMMKDERFDPFIVVVPRIGWHLGDMEETVEKTYKALVAEFGEKYVFRGYHDGVFENRIEECDACAMMNLYSGLADRRFEVIHFATHGVPVFGSGYFYYQGSAHANEYYGMRSLKFVRRFFCSNTSERSKFIECQKLWRNADRLEMSGCPKTDAIEWNDDVGKEPLRKVILVAPHHSVIPTIDSGFCIGNFLRHKDFIQKLPGRYPEVDWIFRPHPYLRLNLIQNVGWSKKQWDDYISLFVSNPNALYEDDGPYYESFKKSSAIIHDCASFLPEYFYTGKPVCYMLASKEARRTQFDDWGQSLIDHTYQAYNEEDITRFIEDVVMKGHDPMKDERQKFARESVMVNYPHASEFIVESIAKMLGRGRKGAL